MIGGSAAEFAATLGVEHRVIDTEEVASPDYAANPINRCYYCKSELYSRLREIADQHQLKHIANGTNVDDLGDHRPGLVSAREANVRSPLCEAELTKQDVRNLARQLELSVWDKPAMPCLSSRIPYEQAVTPKKLAMCFSCYTCLPPLKVSESRPSCSRIFFSFPICVNLLPLSKRLTLIPS